MTSTVRRLGDDRGAAAVEFALVLPILILLVMGIIEFSRAYNAKEALQYAVREGARELALHSGSNSAVAGTIPDLVKSRAIGLDTSAINVPVPASCPSSATASSTATVTATYALPYNIPLFASGTWNLSATGVMRCNG